MVALARQVSVTYMYLFVWHGVGVLAKYATYVLRRSAFNCYMHTVGGVLCQASRPFLVVYT